MNLTKDQVSILVAFLKAQTVLDEAMQNILNELVTANNDKSVAPVEVAPTEEAPVEVPAE